MDLWARRAFVRLTIVHQFVVVGLFTLGALLGRAFAGPMLVAVPSGLATTLIFTGPILRWLCVWPMMPCCPRCGMWVRGFRRGQGDGGLVVFSSPCGHPFRMEGEWVRPPFRDRSKVARFLAEEMGWAQQEDGRVFRFGARFPVVLLDEEGGMIGRRRAKWPDWIVRWTDV